MTRYVSHTETDVRARTHSRTGANDEREMLERLDPRACLQAVAARPHAPRGVAEDALIGWLIALPDGIDPAQAAQELCRHRLFDAAAAEARRLADMLQQVARHPAHALSRRRGRG